MGRMPYAPTGFQESHGALPRRGVWLYALTDWRSASIEIVYGIVQNEHGLSGDRSQEEV